MRTLVSTILVCCAIFFASGCKSSNTVYENIEPHAQMKSSFNDEVYIWENFLFPTNRTTGIQ